MNYKYLKESSKDNMDILKIIKNDREIYLGSRYNHKKDIEKFISKLGILQANDIYIIFGASFLEHVIELQKKTISKNKVLVIEFNKEHIKKLKREKNINNIIITDDKEEVKDFFGNIQVLEGLKVEHYCSYDKIFKDETQQMYEILREKMNSLVINRNTIMKHSDTWFECLFSNLYYARNAIGSDKLKDLYKNKPAVIVSAGPSLDKNIKELKNFDNAIVLSGGRTLRALRDNNIKIDFLGVIDPVEETYKLVQNVIKDEKAPLLMYEGTNKEVVKEHQGEKIIFTSNNFINKIWGGKLPCFAKGGSIAHSLTSFAIYMGCSPIIFIGQDLAYKNGEGHSKIAYGDLEKNKINKNYISDLDIYVEDINGDKVRTSASLKEFKLQFEKLIKINKDFRFIDATEGGAKIEGTEIITLKECIKIYNEEKLNRKNIDLKENKTQNIKNEIKIIKKNLKNYVKLCNTGVDLLNKLKLEVNENKNLDTTLSKLDKLDIKIRKDLKHIHIINDLITATIYKIENEKEFLLNNLDSKDERFDKIYKKNKAIYIELKEVLNRTIVKINKFENEFKFD